MQVRGDDHRYEIRLGFLHHLTVIGVARNMNAAHRHLQIGFVRFGNAHYLNVFLVEIPEYSKMVHPHQAGADNGDVQSHRARTSHAIVERSSPLSAGWTGSDNTCLAASSVTGKRISPVVCSAFVLSGALIHLNVPI